MLLTFWTVPKKQYCVESIKLTIEVNSKMHPFPVYCTQKRVKATISQVFFPSISYHASSGASTSGLVKRLRHCSSVKCPALAVSLAEPGSSSNSISLERTSTYSFSRSLFFHTSSKVQSSDTSSTPSPMYQHVDLSFL